MLVVFRNHVKLRIVGQWSRTVDICPDEARWLLFPGGKRRRESQVLQDTGMMSPPDRVVSSKPIGRGDGYFSGK
jgi:hypothetical protein